jgi:hypothetical protein
MAKEDWKQVDAGTLAKAIGEREAAEVWAMYETSKEAYRAYKAKRDAFEAEMQLQFEAKLPSGMELKFGYNFGKLSIAVGPVTERKAAAKTETGTLTDWLAGQAASGCRT